MTADVNTLSKSMRSPKQDLGSLFHLRYARERQVRKSIIVNGGGLDDEVCDTSWTASMVAGSPVMYSGLLNKGNVNCEGISPLCPGLNLRLGMRNRYKVKIGT
jgi:hypothetical protein